MPFLHAALCFDVTGKNGELFFPSLEKLMVSVYVPLLYVHWSFCDLSFKSWGKRLLCVRRFQLVPQPLVANILVREGYRKELQKVNNDSSNNLACLKLIILL